MFLKQAAFFVAIETRVLNKKLNITSLLASELRLCWGECGTAMQQSELLACISWAHTYISYCEEQLNLLQLDFYFVEDYTDLYARCIGENQNIGNPHGFQPSCSKGT